MNFIGGVEPLISQIKPNDFKYTFDKERRVWVMNVYPYADTFLNSVRDIPWNQYSYNGICEYVSKFEEYGGGKSNKRYKGGSPTKLNVQSMSSPVYSFSGGTVYEILNRRYKNVNLYSYSDPTGDIDCAVYIPQIPYNSAGDVYFLNNDGEVNEYYEDFINWTFTNLVSQMRNYEGLLNDMFPNMVDFDLDEYQDIPTEHKNRFCYKVVKIGKLFIVAFLNENKGMFKIQIVCKIEDSSEKVMERKINGYEENEHINTQISVIDHAVELIFPLPEENSSFSPSADDYDKILNSVNTISFSENNNYSVQKYGALAQDNLDAYVNRRQAYSSDNFKEVIHKPLNHVSRLFYMYELFYQNPEINISNDLYNIIINSDFIKKIGKDFLYYKIENDVFYKVNVDLKQFMNAYMTLFMNPVSPSTPKPTIRTMFSFIIRKYPTLFDISNDNNIYVERHDAFINNLFGNNFNVGGFKRPKRKTKKRKHTNKKKKTSKRNHISKKRKYSSKK